ncbi:MAG: hypothetical protein CSA39_02635 [Flavobacteriales bacterium]|nr:MAG: hypothetical protein CR989_04000 [Flavobacteriales bacterium]PIE49438.1 MAG: hypothetical protein CSA39_02635 [Flavobacteriales bacterium]
MKRVITVVLLTLTLVSCSLDSDNDNIVVVVLPVKSYEVPEFFNYGETHALKVTYDLPDGCHSFYRLYYQQQDTARVVAIEALKNLDATCTEQIIEKEHEFNVSVSQREDYLFKFWKGKDSNNEDIFEEVTIPVVNPN